METIRKPQAVPFEQQPKNMCNLAITKVLEVLETDYRRS
jgi:hypothetical protein